MRWRWIIVISLVVATSMIAYMYIFNHQDRKEHMVQEPTCQINILPLGERMRRAEARVRERSGGTFSFPADLSDNPLLTDDYAQLQIINNSSGLLRFYDCSRTRPNTQSPETVFLTEPEIIHSNGKAFSPPSHFEFLHSIPPLKPPTAAEVQSRQPAVFVLESGQAVELNVSLFSGWFPCEGLKADTYTVRAIILYAEAPSCATKRITSEPVVVTLTEEHIKQAKAYWNR